MSSGKSQSTIIETESIRPLQYKGSQNKRLDGYHKNKLSYLQRGGGRYFGIDRSQNLHLCCLYIWPQFFKAWYFLLFKMILNQIFMKFLSFFHIWIFRWSEKRMAGCVKKMYMSSNLGAPDAHDICRVYYTLFYLMHKIYITFGPDAQDAFNDTEIDTGFRCRLPINNQLLD